MSNSENIVKDGFVSAEKYAELLARLQHVEAYAAEKENQLMTEQLLRKELVDAEIKSEIDGLNAKYNQEIELLKTDHIQQIEDIESQYKEEVEAVKAKAKEDITAIEVKCQEDMNRLLESMERTVEALQKNFEITLSKKVDEAVGTATTTLYDMLNSGIATFRDIYNENSTPDAIDKRIKEFQESAEKAKTAMTEKIEKTARETAKRTISRKHQIDRLVRMVFTKKGEQYHFDDGIKWEDAIADRLNLTDEQRLNAKEARYFLRDYYQRVRAKKILNGTDGKEKLSHGKNKIPETLLRLPAEILWPDEYKQNPDLYDKIGEDKKEWVVVRNLSVVVRVLIRPIVRLKADKFAPPIQAAPVEGPIYKGDPASETLAVAEYNKYCLHIPFYRFLGILSDAGWKVSRSTLNGWHATVCTLLEPLYDLYRKEVMKALFLAGDGSPMPVVDNEKHRTVKNYIVAFRDLVTNLPVFVTTEGGSRSKKAIQGYLADAHCRAFLCDAYSGYNWLSDVGVALCRCNAHSRRKLYEGLKENMKAASEGILQYQLIYNVEDSIKHDGLSGSDITERRNDLARPLWEEFVVWAESTLQEVPDKSYMQEACKYLLNHYEELTAYLDIPEMPIDNNRTEYEIRSMVLGKKNYLFCENEQSCFWAAMMYSFFGGCRAVGANEVDWLTYVLDHIKATPADQLYTLLPQNWIKHRSKKPKRR